MVGTPGSGKTFSIIESFIQQHSAKGVAMVVYDYKFPTLATKLYYHYQKNKKEGKFSFGNAMRKYNIDELPQFWNVLKGDMSVVGPRPHMLYHTEFYKQKVAKYMVCHFVKPGITGWAQVTGFRGETKELRQMEERVKRDIWYIEHWSI